MELLGQKAVEFSRWFLLLNIFFSVALWGSTRPWIADLISRTLLIDVAIFTVGLALGGRTPRLTLGVWLPLLAILLMGWTMALNAFPGPGGMRLLLEGIPGHIAWLPASIDRGVSMRSMTLASGLLGAMCISCDLACNRVWLFRLWRTMALTGVGMVMLGLAQRWTHAHAIYWNLYENAGEYFFGVFRYHANAGAFINLTLPLLAGFALLSLHDPHRRQETALWVTATIATIAASFVNVSRAATAITMLLCAILGLVFVLHLRRKNTGLSFGILTGGGLLVLVILTVVTLNFGIEKSIHRWSHPGNRNAFWGGDRLATYDAIIESLVPRTGVFGSGPGTFEQSFDVVNRHREHPVSGRWDMAHNDYLQILTEWGAIGFFFFALLYGGAIARALSRFGRDSSATKEIFSVVAILSIAGVLVHASVDFPLQIASIQLFTSCLAGALLGIDIRRTTMPRSGPISASSHGVKKEPAP